MQSVNHDNLKNGEDLDKDSEHTTKYDSFAIRTIAVMSIVFLPDTFVAVREISITAPPLVLTYPVVLFNGQLNWQAPKGFSVVSFRFRIH